MKALVATNPGLVRPITLNHKTYEGRPVEGIEIATNVDARDGRPVFLQLGVHHAREWPSGEHAIEWALRARQRLPERRRARPEPGEQHAHDRHPDREPRRLQHEPRGRRAVRERRRPRHRHSRRRGRSRRRVHRRGSTTHVNEYRRKNCRFPVIEAAAARQLHGVRHRAWSDTESTRTATTARSGAATARAAPSSSRTTAAPAPFSEPEIREHPRADVGPPGHDADHEPHVLGPRAAPARRGRRRGRPSTSRSTRRSATRWLRRTATRASTATSSTTRPGRPRTGRTTRPAASATRSRSADLGFHPPFAETVERVERHDRLRTGGGNREAYYKAQENTADPTKHSVLAGQAPNGSVLRLTKTFEMPTSAGGLTSPRQARQQRWS